MTQEKRYKLEIVRTNDEFIQGMNINGYNIGYVFAEDFMQMKVFLNKKVKAEYIVLEKIMNSKDKVYIYKILVYRTRKRHIDSSEIDIINTK